MTGARRAVSAVAAAVLAGVLTGSLTGLPGCGSALRTVPFGPRASTAGAQDLVAVDLAPPPAKVETLPVDPGEPCAWLDGRWEWTARSWEWTPGDWVVPPDDCHFAPPETFWVATAGRGQLFYLPGRWYPRASAGKCLEARSCSRLQGTNR
jgi:hypothetical protein